MLPGYPRSRVRCCDSNSHGITWVSRTTTAVLDGGVHRAMTFLTIYSTAPDGPPTSFHIAVLSCNSIRAEWGLPLPNNRNGVIRGFKLFVQPSAGGEEQLYNIMGNDTTQIMVSNLTGNTEYILSILAYTVGDGPRSIFLTVTTNTEEICEFSSSY